MLASLVDIQILEMEGVAIPEEVPQILKIVDDFLRDYNSQTNALGSPPTGSLKLSWNQVEEKFNCEQVKKPVCCAINCIVFSASFTKETEAGNLKLPEFKYT